MIVLTILTDTHSITSNLIYHKYQYIQSYIIFAMKSILVLLCLAGLIFIYRRTKFDDDKYLHYPAPRVPVYPVR